MNANTTPPNQQIEVTLGLREAVGRRLVRRIIGVLLAVAAIWGLMLVVNSPRGAADSIRYETEPVLRGDLVETVSATGTLVPVNEVEIGSEISGTMLSVEVTFNDPVTNGQVLARIDTSNLAAQVQQSESALEAARAKVLETEATLKEAEAQWARLRQVHEISGGRVPSWNELDAQEATASRAHAGVASARADVSKAQAALDVTRSDMEKAVIVSPIDGFVLSRKIEPGQTVAASFEAPVLFTLAEDLAKLELQVDVDEADVGRVREGQEATFTVDAYPDRHFPAIITQVRYGSKTTEGVVTYTTVLKVSNDDLSLRPGMTATAAITTRKAENALLVPTAALRFEPPQESAGVPEENTSGKRSLISSILPGPPSQNRKANATRVSGPPTVHVLEGGRLRSAQVTTGLSDGIQTQVTAGSIEPGMNLVTTMKAGRK
jgi:HlyD family secretion protein